MLFKYFDDFFAAEALAVAQQVADLDYGCFQGVKPCGRLKEDI
ncbi:MAG TPA: hypothetical protein VE485_06825 [Mycobacterium sp.]|nr:hypothetical protein [Mycobacterium sp.]